MLAGLGIAALAAPAEVIPIVVAVAAAYGSTRFVPRPRLAWLGALVALAALAVIAVTPHGAITSVASVALGAGVGLTLPERQRLDRLATGVTAVVGIALIVLAASVDDVSAPRLAAAFVVICAVTTIATSRHVRPRLGRRGVAIMSVAAVLAGGLVAWVGANDPTVQWFGHITTHGDRHGNQVAITFDDGPNGSFTRDVAQILDARGVKGTFFEVGKAVEAEPDVARALLADGHLLGNHSFHHDSWRWLDPRYPELDRTETAIHDSVGVCPAFFRPPHGQRTPFMLAHVDGKDMHTVTWDVSASDWTDTDGARVADKILANVRPGSIILLHDGLNGNVGADRSVLLSALPRILDGLQAKGLTPVRLDQLLHQPAYLDHC
jgi:peptidoglycan/xylan/chitin deacetylase (PgdA/CDA1 family)